MILNDIRNLARNRNGAIAMMMALSMPILVGSAALASDVIQNVWLKRAMQRQADSAALAGAFAVSQGKAATPNVNADLARNVFSGIPTTSIIENAPTTGAYAGNATAVRVALTAELNLPFSRFITGTSQVMFAEATAASVIEEQNCAIGLENGNKKPGIKISGTAKLQFACGLFSNSAAGKSVDASNGTTVNTPSVSAVGNVPASPAYPSGTTLHPYVAATIDPYASLPNPVIPSYKPPLSTTLSPGTYDGLTLQGNVTLGAGEYYIDGGTFKINAGATVSGTGVTIILTSKTAASNGSSVADIDINGTATVNLSAATSGTYANVLIYQDRRANDSGSATINGNSTTKLNGAIYIPARELKINGTSEINFTCLKLVAKRLEFSGTTKINNTCASGAFKGSYVRLVA